MVYKIVWSTLALKTYISNIEYLEVKFTEREVKKFIAVVERKLAILSIQPNTGRLTGKRLNLRQTVIHKRILLIYRFKQSKSEIELARFFNTWQHPKKLKK